MSDQLSFGFDPPDRPDPSMWNRLFFAFLPDPETAARMAALAVRFRRHHGLRGYPIPRERLHVSVHMLGEFAEPPPELLAAASKVGEALRACPFHVTFDRICNFSGLARKPVVLRGPEDARIGFDAFHFAFIARMAEFGLAVDRAGIVEPHVTLIYDEKPIPETTIAPIRFRVEELVLIHSLFGRGKHIHLGRWRLSG